MRCETGRAQGKKPHGASAMASPEAAGAPAGVPETAPADRTGASLANVPAAVDRDVEAIPLLPATITPASIGALALVVTLGPDPAARYRYAAPQP